MKKSIKITSKKVLEKIRLDFISWKYFLKKKEKHQASLTEKSSRNLRVYFLALEITQRVLVELEVNHFERIPLVLLAPHCLHPRKMNLWSKQVKKAIVIEFVVPLEVLKHLDFEVSKIKYVKTMKILPCSHLMESI